MGPGVRYCSPNERGLAEVGWVDSGVSRPKAYGVADAEQEAVGVAEAELATLPGLVLGRAERGEALGEQVGVETVRVLDIDVCAAGVGGELAGLRETQVDVVAIEVQERVLGAVSVQVHLEADSLVEGEGESHVAGGDDGNDGVDAVIRGHEGHLFGTMVMDADGRTANERFTSHPSQRMRRMGHPSFGG